MRAGERSPLAPFIGDRTPRVLVVEDQPVSLEVMRAHLVRWGCQVRTAGTGAQAITVVRSFNPDLVIMDVVLPDQSGFAVCEALQANPNTAHIPVIFVSALTSLDAKVMGFDTGGYDYMTKPFDAGELAARVGARLRQKYAEDELRAKVEKLRAKIDTDPLSQT